VRADCVSAPYPTLVPFDDKAYLCTQFQKYDVLPVAAQSTASQRWDVGSTWLWDKCCADMLYSVQCRPTISWKHYSDIMRGTRMLASQLTTVAVGARRPVGGSMQYMPTSSCMLCVHVCVVWVNISLTICRSSHFSSLLVNNSHRWSTVHWVGTYVLATRSVRFLTYYIIGLHWLLDPSQSRRA